jgi:hypothetical protein
MAACGKLVLQLKINPPNTTCIDHEIRNYLANLMKDTGGYAEQVERTGFCGSDEGLRRLYDERDGEYGASG